MNDEQKIGLALKMLTEVYQGSYGDLADAIERADSQLFDILAILKGI